MAPRKERTSRGKEKLEREGTYGGVYSTLNKVGKTGRRNARALKVFKKECARLGVERCEVRYEGCTVEATTWAHGRRRRLLKEGELEAFAVAACIPCHTTLDQKMNHEACAAEVSRIIALRPERYLEVA